MFPLGGALTWSEVGPRPVTVFFGEIYGPIMVQLRPISCSQNALKQFSDFRRGHSYRQVSIVTASSGSVTAPHH